MTSEEIEVKYEDSPRFEDIESLCVNSRFGTDANFSAAVEPLKKMIVDIVELEDLDYRGKLTKSEISNIDTTRNNIIRFINEIKSFSLSVPNPVDTRNTIVDRIDSYYQNQFAGFVRQPLIYLKDQVRKTAKDEDQLRKLVLKTEEINTELESRLNDIKEKEVQLQEDKKSLELGKGLISSKYLSSQFESEVHKSNLESKYWQKWIFWLSLGLIASVVGLFLGYFFWIRILEDKYLSIEYGVAGITFIALVFFFLRIVLRNYNVEKHTASLNRHRVNVSSTIENLLGLVGHDESLKEVLLKEGSMAMFNVGSTGYLDKEQMEVSTPIKEAITLVSKN